jgi:catechol-2,3-dioxygenase
MASPAKLAHVVWKTAQLDVMRDWYLTVLEAKVAFDNGFIAFITYDDEHHRVAFVNTGATQRPTDGHSGINHVAFTYASLPDLLDTYERLRDGDIEPFWCINHGPTISMYYRDPDGNHIELQIDVFASDAELQAWFASGAFGDNPIGVNFDPDDLLTRYRSGVPEAELVAPW